MSSLFFFLIFIYLFIYLWLCRVFVTVQGLSPAAASGGHSSSRCADLSLSWRLLLRSTGSRRAGSLIVAHGPSGSAACGIFPDQGSNPCPLHWQADSQPLHHQGSPVLSSLDPFFDISPPPPHFTPSKLSYSLFKNAGPIEWFTSRYHYHLLGLCLFGLWSLRCLWAPLLGLGTIFHHCGHDLNELGPRTLGPQHIVLPFLP